MMGNFFLLVLNKGHVLINCFLKRKGKLIKIIQHFWKLENKINQNFIQNCFSIVVFYVLN